MSKIQTLIMLLFLLVTISASKLKNSLRDTTSTKGGCAFGKYKYDCFNNDIVVGKHCCQYAPGRWCHASFQADGSYDYKCTWI